MTLQAQRFWQGFGARLKAARLLAGYSQRDMEMELHLGQATMSRWEHGTAHPGWLIVRRMCVMLAIGPETLFRPLSQWRFPEDFITASLLTLRVRDVVPGEGRRARTLALAASLVKR